MNLTTLTLQKLVLILLADSLGIGALERSYSKVAKMCYKDQLKISSSTLEILYLLCCLQTQNYVDELFAPVRNHL